jgi:hypothetical protein
MTEDLQALKKKRRPLLLALSILLGLLIAVVVPPLVSINSYKGRITQLMAESLGRPVHMSSVELHILPVPSFVLTDLTVQEDPAYGVEPVLKADTVTASIRLLSVWRGRLEISKVSVENASLNVVRTPEGRWNLDPFFRTAAKAQPGQGIAGQGSSIPASQRPIPFPYLEATSLRINFKRGAEKLPFSLLDTDFSFWQDQPGDWRIRLRGQPARTDLSLDLADTGLVRLEARARQAPELRQIPVHLDLEWREAQLGQLSRLLVGSDPGWRGDLTGELHLDGTPETARVQTRLRATAVHRAEFAPAAPMDFDATCAFLYHLSARAVDNLACDSPLGNGRIHVEGDLPGNGVSPHLSIALDKIPVAAGLDALRTVRSGFGPGLQASGLISGKISYAPPAPGAISARTAQAHSKAHSAKPRPPLPSPLTGSLNVEGFELSGPGLSAPIQASKLVLQPVAPPSPAQQPARGRRPVATLPIAILPGVAQPAVLETTITVPGGAPTPLSITARLALSGYHISLRGQAALRSAREFAALAGIPHANAIASLTGDPVTIDIAAAGPWQPPSIIPFANTSAPLDASDVAIGASLAAQPAGVSTSDTLTGTVALRNASWEADYLASPLEIVQATLNLDNRNLRWDPVVFSYGPVKGTATLSLPSCEAETPRSIASTQIPPNQADSPCQPVFAIHFAALDAAALQAAFLGARQPGTLLSSLLARLKPSTASAPALPLLQGNVTADSLIVGPVALTSASATLHVLSTGAELSFLKANLLGGHFDGEGTFQLPADQGKPAYTFQGQLENINAARLGQLLALQCAGGPITGKGKISLSGFAASDLGSSAKGELHFDWRKGSVIAESADSPAIPAALARFDGWTADAVIAGNALTFETSKVQQASVKQTATPRQTVGGSVTFSDPPQVTFTVPPAPPPGP